MQQRELATRLRKIGYRMTAQRALLLEAIYTFEGHFTVEMLRTALAEASPTVDCSTVYRTLDLLCELGVIHALTGHSPTEYERTREPHHHLVCRECGAVITLADHHFDGLASHLLEDHSFEVDLTHLAIPGRCLGCIPNPSIGE